MIKIVENRRTFIIVSIAAILIGVIVMIVNQVSGRGAFNYDVEFSGGTSFTIDIGQEFSNDDIITIVREATGQEAPQVQRVTGATQVMLRMRSIDKETRESLIQTISEKYSLTNDAFTYSDISATVSEDMQRSAVLAVVVSCAAMLVYVSIRFRDIRMGSAAILALLHDALVMIAFYAILRIPLNYSFIAAVLTILGYSINSTIVIFDRIRENRGIMRRVDFAELVNTSVNQTMRRSIFTSCTVFLVVLVLYILGVSSIKEFSLPIMIGVIAGAYSSIFLSGSFWYMFNKKPAQTLKPALANAGSGNNKVVTNVGGNSKIVTNSSAEAAERIIKDKKVNSSPRRKHRKHR
ncbi:MAG: protein translocase subunit SecF [Clostridiales bacterium]|jgi:preprotein translocase SecF subunit|nr:protein translocase subunit SecF [Clostridiales bacterium]